MRLSDSTNIMELTDIYIQYLLDRDMPVLIRNLVSCLSNYRNPQNKIKDIGGKLYQPSNKNKPWYLWFDIDELAKCISLLTQVPAVKCKNEIYRAIIWEKQYLSMSQRPNIPIVGKTFFIGYNVNPRRRTMVHSLAELDDLGRRNLYKRHPLTHNLIMIREQAIKEDLMQLCDVKSEIYDLIEGGAYDL